MRRLNVRQVRAVLRKEWWHIVRDRRTAVLVTISPVFFLVALSYSFSVDIDHVDFAVIDHDRTPRSRALVAALHDSGDLRLCCAATGYDQAERWLTDGSVKAYVVVPPGFMADTDARRPVSVQVIVDGTDPATAEHVLQHVVARTTAFGATIAAGVPLGVESLAGASNVALTTRTWYNPSLRRLMGMVPALVAVVLALPAVSASLAITREREWGTLEALLASPVGRAELLLGKLLPYVASGTVSAVLCAAVAVAWFHVPFRGSFGLFLLLSADFLVATVAVGLLLSILLKSQQAAMIAALLVFLFPGFFLSGIFIPLSAMGELRYEAMLLPTTHYVLINRGLFLKGVSLAVLWPWGLALLALGLTTVVLALFLFRKRLG